MATLGEQVVNSTVKIKENGSPVNFLVVHQGSPSAEYEGFDGGTVLLRTDIHSKGVYDSSNNDYANSDIHAWGNGTYLNSIEADVRNQIMQVKIPYRKGTSGSSVSSGANGLSCKVFFLSTKEVDSTESYSPNEGAVFSYFKGGGNSKRIARYNGQADYWWLRSPGTDHDNGACYVYSDGIVDFGIWGVTYSYGRRPAFVLPSSLIVDSSGNVLVNQPPTAPSSISASNVVGNQNATVTLGAATDEDGTIANYIYERKVDSGSWTQFASTSSLSVTDSINDSWTTVTYRAKAVDNMGAEGPYATSQAYTVVHNQPPTAPGSINVTGVVASGTATITLTAATDPDGTIASYRYERSVDSGAWTQFADVNSLTQTDSVSGDWGTVAYRACAVDDAGETGPYATSETETVNSGWVTIGGPDSALGQRIKPFTLSAAVNVTGATGTPSLTVTCALDGKQVSSQSLTAGSTASIFVDTRTLATGQHTIQMTAEASDYLPANKAWQFSVPMDELPDGGKAEQLWDDDGNAIFPRTTSQQVIGKNGLSIQNELDNMEKRFRGLTGHLEHVDTVYLASAGAQVEVPREAGEHYTFMPYPSNTNGAALVTSGSNAAANIGSNITVTPSADKFAIALSAATASIVVVSKFVQDAEANVTTNPVALFTALDQPQVVSVSGGTTETVADQTEALQTIIDENPNANYYILEDADGTKYYVATTTLVNAGTASITGPVYRDDQSTTLYRNSTVYFGKLGSNLAPGDVIKIKENGSPVNFVIVHKGSPSAAYVGFDNGLVVLRQDIHSKGVYDSSNNDYANSDLNAWGNGAYLNTIDEAVRSKILNVKIPYRPGTSGSTVSSGENGLSCKVFFPSTKEVDSTESYSPNEGAVFSYFKGGGNSKRIARYNGQADYWWLRSPYTGNNGVYLVNSGGYVGNYYWNITDSYGRRPAFVLPNTIVVTNDGTVIG